MQGLRERMTAIVERLAPEGRASARQELERLWQLGVESYDDLLAFATSKQEPDLRATACWYLGRLGDCRGLSTLARCLHDEDVYLRCAAARALGELGGDEAGAQLVECLELERDPDVRMAAAYGLQMTGGPRAAGVLLSISRDTHEEDRVRGMAIESLAYVADSRVVTDLVELLDDPSVEVRFWTIFSLGQLGDASLIPTLERLLGDDECLFGVGSIANEAVETIEILRSNRNDQS